MRSAQIKPDCVTCKTHALTTTTPKRRLALVKMLYLNQNKEKKAIIDRNVGAAAFSCWKQTSALETTNNFLQHDAVASEKSTY